MKLKIEQLQALDCLLHIISSKEGYSMSGKNIQAVIKLENQFWTGKFLIQDRAIITQTDMYGDQREESAYNIEQFNSLFQHLTGYSKKLENRFHDNPLKTSDSLHLQYLILTSILSKTGDPSSFPLHRVMYNAKSLDGKCEIPFIDLTSYAEIELVSLIEIADE